MKYLSNLSSFILLLKNKGIKLCIAESLTGGMLASEFTKKEGASKFFEFSIVCYSNNSKHSFFKIKPIIDKFGVVSSEVAREMLIKLDKYSQSKNNLNFSCTGFASKDRGLLNSDIGKVYIGVSYMDKIVILEKKFKNYGRNYIIKQTINELIKEGQKIINR